MDLSKTRVDVARTKRGEWVKGIPGLGDIEVMVRGSNSPQFRLAQAKAQRAIPREARREGGLIDPEAADAALGAALAEGVLLDWRNVEDGGEPVPYSAAKALELMTDPEMAVFRDGVAWAAEIVGAARKEDDDAALGK